MLWAYGLCSASFIINSSLFRVARAALLCLEKRTRKQILQNMALQLLKLPINIISLCFNGKPSLSFLSHPNSQKLSGTLSTLFVRVYMFVFAFFAVELIVVEYFWFLTNPSFRLCINLIYLRVFFKKLNFQ
jgi:hypothetical protein